MAVTTVSVIIPAYNSGRTIRRAIASVLAQTSAPHEIILADDGSTDATVSLAASLSIRNLQIIAAGSNHGAAAARNRGIERASGEYVAFLDADDEWLPDKTARQIEIISSQSRMGMIGCYATLVSDRRGMGEIVSHGRPVATGPDAWKTLLAYSFMASSSVIARRQLVLRAGGFDETLPVAEDQDMWIRLARLAEVGFLLESQVRCHDAPGSLVKRNKKESRTLTLAVVERHIERAGPDLSPAERRWIRGSRYEWLGRSAFVEGELAVGAALLVKAAALGRRPLACASFLLVASPPARWTKARLRKLWRAIDPKIARLLSG